MSTLLYIAGGLALIVAIIVLSFFVFAGGLILVTVTYCLIDDCYWQWMKRKLKSQKKD